MPICFDSIDNNATTFIGIFLGVPVELPEESTTTAKRYISLLQRTYFILSRMGPIDSDEI